MKYTPQNTKIAVIGGGNVGTQFACICSSKGYSVKLHSSKPELYDGTLEVIDENSVVTTGKIEQVTADIEEVVDGCQIILVTYPAFRLAELAAQMLPYINKDMNICVIPGTGGAEFAFKNCIDAGATLFGLQRVPSVARLEKYGKRVRCEGLRSELYLASIPNDKGYELSEFMSFIWGIPCTVLPNYLNVTLTPSNPILHTARLRTLFSDYESGKIYKNNPLFYGEWNDEASELLIACDEELQNMLKIIDKLDLSYVRSLKLHYESNTSTKMTEKLCSIKSLHNLRSPMNQVDGGWVPNFNSRYFMADFPYGLAIIEAFAALFGVQVPNISETMEWYRKTTGDKSSYNLNEYGINTINDIYSLYES